MSKSNYDINTHTTHKIMLHNIIQVVEEKIMARTKSDNVQINISIPTGWKTELENLARIYLLKKEKLSLFLDLMRRGIQEKYQLGEKDSGVEEQYHSCSHCKYLIQYHIIWCPKFRFSVLQGNVDIILKQILQKICNDYKYKIKALEVMPRSYTYFHRMFRRQLLLVML